MCGARYAFDTDVPEPEFLAASILKLITPGAIWLVHMPEQGFREWELETMRRVLDGLQARRLRSVTLTELQERARQRT